MMVPRWFFPKKNIIVVGEKSACRYLFRFGRLVSQEFFPLSFVSSQTGTVFLDTLPQEIHVGRAPKLKLLDRKSFLYHALTSQFGTMKWLAYCWLSSQAYLAVKVERVSILPSSLAEGTACGILGGELLRLEIFQEGEGLILAPSQEGAVREIYLKNHCPNFIRLAEPQELNWDKEIDALKRYLERHYQADPQTLKAIWWGPRCPSQKLKHYASTFFEDDLVRHSVRFLTPALPCHPLLSPHPFSLKKGMRFLTIFFSVVSIFLTMQFFWHLKEFWQNEKSLRALKTALAEKQKELYQAQRQLNDQRKPLQAEWDMKSVVKVYEKILPLTVFPFVWLQKISVHVKQACRTHEIFWGRGQVAIHPKDQSVRFSPLSFESFSEDQGLVLGVTGPSIERLQSLERILRKDLSSASVELWEPQEIAKGKQKMISGLIHVQTKNLSHGNP